MRSILISFFLYCLTLALVRQIWPNGILFYQGTILALLHALTHAFVILLTKKNTQRLSPSSSSLIVLLMSYTFMFTIPTTVDRSYSVYMLNQIATSPNGLKEEALRQDFKALFVDGGALDRRIEEQLATGSIIRDGEQIKLTPWGNFLTKSFRFFCVTFSCSA
jgi:hypothetical protein